MLTCAIISAICLWQNAYSTVEGDECYFKKNTISMKQMPCLRESEDIFIIVQSSREKISMHTFT